MGAFILSIRTRDGREANRLAVPNTLCNEGIERLYRQMFPPYGSTIDIRIGIAGGDLSGPLGRPQATGGGYPVDLEAVFADAVGDGNEGGGYTSHMRTSFGYFRPVPAWTVDQLAGGGHIGSDYVEFPNNHVWTPQDGDDWDDPSTTPAVEVPPPEWYGRIPPDPEVKYPWHWPRKLDTNLGSDPNIRYSYMHTWDTSGSLDWLADFRKIGGFPITFAFLCDNDNEALIAVGYFRAPIHLWPGTTLHVRYEARAATTDNNSPTIATGAFLERFLRFAFAGGGARYAAIYVRPILSSFTGTSRTMTYADVLPHFHADLIPRDLAAWTYVPYSAPDPARIESDLAPEWRNEGDQSLTVGGLAVYGYPSPTPELMWVTRFDSPITLAIGDTLRVPDKVRFALAPNL